MRPIVRPVLVMAALALAVFGCASGGTSTSPGGPGGDSAVDSGPAVDSPATSTGGVPCTATDPFGLEPGPTGATPIALTPSFVPVEATRCLLRTETVPGDGEWMIRVEQRAGGDLSALATELRRPDALAPAGTACTAIGYIPIIITLVDAAGATTVPALPREACGGPQRAAVEAIEGLSWQLVKETPVRQTRSELEIGSGCSGAYKPVVAILAADGGGTYIPGPIFTPTPVALQVCRYEIDRSQTSVQVNGVDIGLGVLTSAGTVEGAALTQFLTAVDQAPAAEPTCAESPASFADVYPKGDGGPHLGVELGGCYRYAPDSGGLRQLDAATVALLMA